MRSTDGHYNGAWMGGNSDHVTTVFVFFIRESHRRAHVATGQFNSIANLRIWIEFEADAKHFDTLYTIKQLCIHISYRPVATNDCSNSLFNQMRNSIWTGSRESSHHVINIRMRRIYWICAPAILKCDIICSVMTTLTTQWRTFRSLPLMAY